MACYSADDTVYVATANSDAAIRAIPVAGGDAMMLAQGNLPASLLVDDAAVYWTEYIAGEIRKVAR